METSKYDILIVTALELEFRTLDNLLNLEYIGASSKSTLSYYQPKNDVFVGSEKNYFIVVTCLYAMGNTSSGVDAANALHDLNPTYVFMFGIAGGLKSRVNLTDVIVPNNIFYHALGKQRPQGTETRVEPIRIDPTFLQRLHAYAYHVSTEKHYDIKFNPIASGEQVMSSDKHMEDLLQIHPKMLGAEMESYGVGLAVSKYQSDILFGAIRGVSDYGEDDKGNDKEKDDYHRAKALENAADFLLGFIKSEHFPARQISINELPKFVAIHHLSLYRRSSIRQAVRDYLKRFKHHDVIELPIGQTDLFENGSLNDPAKALLRQNEVLLRMEEILQQNTSCQLGYFGLAHIPLVFHMGHKINRREVLLFGNDYGNGQWIDLPDEGTAPTTFVEGLPVQPVSEEGDAILLLSISHLIKSPEPEQVVENPLALIHIRLEEPHEGIIDSMQALNHLVQKFREVRDEILAKLPSINRLHLFYAGPPVLAFRCGQQISSSVDPETIVYNYSRRDHPHYRWALNLQTDEIIERG